MSLDVSFGIGSAFLWWHIFGESWIGLEIMIKRYCFNFVLAPNESHYGNKLFFEISKWVDDKSGGVESKTIVNLARPILKLFYPIWKFQKMD